LGEQVRLSDLGKTVVRCREDIPEHFSNVELDEYVVMPDHIHGSIVLTEPAGAIHESAHPATPQRRRKMKLSKIVGRFKMVAAKEITIIQKTPGKPVWQRNYYEHSIRDDKDLENIREYIRHNPMKWPTDEENPDCKLMAGNRRSAIS
jgi:putative transposase